MKLHNDTQCEDDILHITRADPASIYGLGISKEKLFII